MPRIAAGAALAVLTLVVIGQFAIPPVAESEIEKRLEKGGGTATASLGAFPAVRLLWQSGSHLRIEGEGLELDLEQQLDDPLGRLDKFGEVEILLEEMTAAGVDVATFALRRGKDDADYYLRINATTTPSAMGAELGRLAGGALGGLAGQFGAGLFGGDTPIPVEVEGAIDRADGGRIDVDDLDAAVAGIPTGPFTELLVQSVLDRI